MKALCLAAYMVVAGLVLHAQPEAVLTAPIVQGSEIMLDLQDTAGIIAIQAASAPVNQTTVITTITLGHVTTCDSTCHPPPAKKNKRKRSASH